MSRTMNRRLNSRFWPNIVELERRDTPAWWNIAAPSPAEGTAGSPAATLTGTLGINPGHTVNNGTVLIFAPTAAEAAIEALSGTISVEFEGETVEYFFGPDSVGDVSDHKAFAVSVSGSDVVILLEDMADFPDATPDWDYNDQSWEVTIGGASSPEIYEGTFQWTDPNVGSETVTVTVTAIDADTYKWNYHLVNDSFIYHHNGENGEGFGIGQYTVEMADGTVVIDAGSTIDADSFTVSGGETTDDAITWEWADGVEGSPGMMPGDEADFYFTTAPLPVDEESEGDVTDTLETVESGGGVAAPGPKPKIQITYGDYSEVTTQGLRVAKLENSFRVNTANDVNATVIPPDPNDSNRDFIDRDTDRFIVWVYDPVKWNAVDNMGSFIYHTKVGIQTYDKPSSDNGKKVVDDLTMVDVVRTNAAPGSINFNLYTGWYRSDTQVLVSNRMDDTYVPTAPQTVLQADDQGPGGPAPIKFGNSFFVSDRTHKAQLGGVVVAKYAMNDASMVSSNDFSVPVDKYVKVTVKSLSINGVAILSEAAANRRIEAANEQLAQVHIKLVATYNPILSDLPGVNLSKNGLDLPIINGQTGRIANLTTETKALLNNTDYRTESLADVEIFVVNKLYDTTTGEYPTQGFAIPKYCVDNSYYANVLLLAENEVTKPFTWPHEITHLLTDYGHYTTAMKQINLMRAGTYLTDSFIASKRIFTSQDERIRVAAPELLLNAPPA